MDAEEDAKAANVDEFDFKDVLDEEKEYALCVMVHQVMMMMMLFVICEAKILFSIRKEASFQWKSFSTISLLFT